MAISLEIAHRCGRCRNWSKNWQLCQNSAPTRERALLTTRYLNNQKDALSLDQDWLDGFNGRFSAVLKWWQEHIGGPYNEDHIVAIAVDFDDVPASQIISILNQTLFRAKAKPYSLRYFKVALEEGRGAYFKSQDTGARRTNESTADIVARIVARQNRQGGPS